ncbi:hypothetical protein FGG78_23565 [Thioclava sp. BHET1]|nr:hypothetical protein FGG78_23565 [Thioclava sp. BHET1]
MPRSDFIAPETAAETAPVRLAGIGPETRIAVIANRKSGTNARDSAAIDRAIAILGPERTKLHHWTPGEDLSAQTRRLIDEGAGLIVAAGGDGTAMAMAGAMLGQDCPMAVLPLGTFNFFTRGLGLPEDPDAAARAILTGQPRPIAVGTVNGQAFLNNASLGIYPAILRERESIYRRWGRRRIVAHWSVIRTFLRFQRPMRLHLTADGKETRCRTPLIFIARSAYQLDHFGLDGAGIIHDDDFAVLIGRGETRADLFRLAWRLVTGRCRRGRDYDLISARALRIETGHRRSLLAFDGEKRRETGPFDFRMQQDALTILTPAESGSAPES